MKLENGAIGKALTKLHNKFSDLGCACTVEDLVDMIISGTGEHWKWRLQMAQLVADSLDFERYGILSIYIIGSTKNAIAGPLSDIDLLIHHHADEAQVHQLSECITQWGEALAEMNFYRTGLKSANLIDLHLITSQDIILGNSFAVMIGRTSDGARLLRTISNP